MRAHDTRRWVCACSLDSCSKFYLEVMARGRACGTSARRRMMSSSARCEAPMRPSTNTCSRTRPRSSHSAAAASSGYAWLATRKAIRRAGSWSAYSSTCARAARNPHARRQPSLALGVVYGRQHGGCLWVGCAATPGRPLMLNSDRGVTAQNQGWAIRQRSAEKAEGG